MSPRLTHLITLLVASMPLQSVAAQEISPSTRAQNLYGPVLARDARLFPAPVRLAPYSHRIALPLSSDSVPDPHVGRAVIGGLVGLVAGVAVCTVISSALFNEGSGLSTCTTHGNLIFAGGGFALGFTIGWLSTPRRPGA